MSDNGQAFNWEAERNAMRAPAYFGREEVRVSQRGRAEQAVQEDERLPAAEIEHLNARRDRALRRQTRPVEESCARCLGPNDTPEYLRCSRCRAYERKRRANQAAASSIVGGQIEA